MKIVPQKYLNNNSSIQIKHVITSKTSTLSNRIIGCTHEKCGKNKYINNSIQIEHDITSKIAVEMK
jgi:hypothetical protein